MKNTLSVLLAGLLCSSAYSAPNEYSGNGYENFLGHEYGSGGQNGSGQQPAPKRVINIPSHWGAVAIDPTKGIAGVSENVLEGKRAAKKQAIQACENRGGQDCKVTGFVRNACIAYGQAVTQKSHSPVPVRTGKTIKEAESEVQAACKTFGAIECKIYYSHCNKDPRYDMY